MAGAAEDPRALAQAIMSLAELPFNDRYLSPNPDNVSQFRAIRDPNIVYNDSQSIEGLRLYNLFNDGGVNEFYAMYVDPNTTPLAKFYFFNQILEESNEKIHDPLYIRINDEIRRLLFERTSDLSQMFMDTLINSRKYHDKTDQEKHDAIEDGTNPGLRFIAGMREPAARNIAMREILSRQMKPGDYTGERMGENMGNEIKRGGKRYSKFKRKSKKINRKKSRRRHRRS